MALGIGGGVRIGIVAGLFVALATVPAHARISPADVNARPLASVTATTLPAGISKLGHDALAYRPASLPPGPRPLLVLLHGMGGQAGDLLQLLRDEADRRGMILVGLKSRGATWDAVPTRSGAAARRRSARLEFRSAADVARMNEVLSELFAAAAVDPDQVALLGFSDGASVALSMGIANPELFPTLIAMSPGFFADPHATPRRQRVFVGHGERDSVLPIANALSIADHLKGMGLRVRFHSFAGGHRLDKGAITRALDYAFPATARPKRGAGG